MPGRHQRAVDDVTWREVSPGGIDRDTWPAYPCLTGLTAGHRWWLTAGDERAILAARDERSTAVDRRCVPDGPAGGHSLQGVEY